MKRLVGMTVKTGVKIIDKNEKLFRFQLIDTGNNTFAILMSIAHMIADGFTFYTFLNMLRDNQEVKAMNCERNHDLLPKISELKGDLDDD